MIRREVVFNILTVFLVFSEGILADIKKDSIGIRRLSVVSLQNPLLGKNCLCQSPCFLLLFYVDDVFPILSGIVYRSNVLQSFQQAVETLANREFAGVTCMAALLKNELDTIIA